jgi:hypothetical protein
MTTAQTLSYLALWSAIGIVLFSGYVVLVFRAGLVYTAREEDGTLKKRIPLAGLANMALFLLLIVGFQAAANYFSLANRGFSFTFGKLFLLNYGHYLILIVYDTLVIDWLVLGRWRPRFLKMPDAMGSESMRKHILISIPVSALAGLTLVGVSTGVSFALLW